jgi:hypothetical protein
VKFIGEYDVPYAPYKLRFMLVVVKVTLAKDRPEYWA